MIKDVAKALFPPDFKPLQLYRLSYFAVTMLLVLDVFLTRGCVSGVAGFARADEISKINQEVADVKQNVDMILILSIEQRMRELAQAQCGAAPTTAALIQGQIDQMQMQHRELAGANYTIVATCDAG